MSFFQSKRFYFALFAVIIAAAVHGWEHYEFQLEQGVHLTADDASYIRPVENFLNQGVWKDNSTGASSYVQRPPLMGWIHGGIYLIFGKYTAFAFYLLALILHGCAVFQLPKILEKINGYSSAYSLTLIYSVLPCFWGFLSYQITEAISGSFVIFILSICVSKYRYKISVLIFSLILLLLFRPLLILLFPFAFCVIWKDVVELIWKFKWQQIALILFGLTLFFSWEIRKGEKLGEYGVIHPIYHRTNESVFRPAHASLTNLFRIWETRPEQFHRIVGQCWSEEPNSIDSLMIQKYISERKIPLQISEFLSVLNAYKAANQSISKQFNKNGVLLESQEEIDFRIRVESLTNQLKKAHFLQYYVTTPCIGMREQLTKSQLNLGLFQQTFRGVWWAEILRWICLIVLTIGYVMVPIFLFKGNSSQRWMSLGVILYCVYLFWFQRLNEDRYLVPCFPILFLLLASSIPMAYRTMMNSVRRFF